MNIRIPCSVIVLDEYMHQCLLNNNLKQQWRLVAACIYDSFFISFLTIFLAITLVPLPCLLYSNFLRVCELFNTRASENTFRLYRLLQYKVINGCHTAYIIWFIYFIDSFIYYSLFFLYTDLVLDLELPVFLHWCHNSWGLMAASVSSTSKIHHLAYLLGLIGRAACDLPQYLYQRTPPFPCSHRVHLVIIQWRLMM